MKTILTAVILLAAADWAEATLVTGSFGGGTIADGNPVGQVFTGNFTTAPSGDQVLGITVNLNVSGGYNGNLYAYLVAPNGTMVLLLNRPGVNSGNLFGAGGAGMNITLKDGTSDYGSIQNASSAVLTGSYNAAGGASALSAFNGSSADGKWELFFADMVKGGGNSTLNGWSLNITVVPEPVTLALGMFAAMLLALAGLRRLWQTQK